MAVCEPSAYCADTAIGLEFIEFIQLSMPLVIEITGNMSRPEGD
jgi:hypothetical protein